MGKIKINLDSGVSAEKPLINAFIENGNNYVVLDNETNGSMGLPIILVSKCVDNKLLKIADQSEWQSVKEYLKNIIAGNKSEFVNINNELMAEDIYYTQLTLPVPSFDALKKAYPFNATNTVETNPVAEAINNVTEEKEVAVASSPVENVEVASEAIAPVVEPIPVENTEVTSDAVSPIVESAPVEEPTNAEVNTPVFNIEVDNNPTIDEPKVENTINFNDPLNTIEFGSGEEKQEFEREPEITPTPIIETTIGTEPNVQESIFKEQKEAFMQACENMFDALVQKFEKELEKK